MKTRQEYINLIAKNADVLRTEYGVRSICLFGSVARENQRSDSDVDVCVDMVPKMLVAVRLKRFLEKILDSEVDVVRLHNHMNKDLKTEIARDGIYIFK